MSILRLLEEHINMDICRLIVEYTSAPDKWVEYWYGDVVQQINTIPRRFMRDVNLIPSQISYLWKIDGFSDIDDHIINLSYSLREINKIGVYDLESEYIFEYFENYYENNIHKLRIF